MTNNESLLAVTQEDREAAADIWRDFVARPGEVIVEKVIRSGGMDDSTLVQAFARHPAARPAHPAQPGREEVGAAVEMAIRKAIPDVHILISDGFYDDAAAVLANAALASVREEFKP